MIENLPQWYQALGTYAIELNNPFLLLLLGFAVAGIFWLIDLLWKTKRKKKRELTADEATKLEKEMLE